MTGNERLGKGARCAAESLGSRCHDLGLDEQKQDASPMRRG